ncbi:LRR repeats and ubiquitin-like domain-containing protein [Trifolium pratense]|uniref:LRR repeats and ubiquitin-like domain-containing protein n=1 Tax=Trifolium pratense TaxID=57577 RepID=A0A2K3LH45_TRIPR|nr:LRR repeats and ubiquitin-like domain-containing protein [Trifolium pratense]
MENDGGATESNSNATTTTITINVKFSGSSIPISISPQSTIKELKSLLLPATNVLPRGQKLIFKGKVLEDPSTLAASNLSNGSKVMLMASQGLYQGP